MFFLSFLFSSSFSSSSLFLLFFVLFLCSSSPPSSFTSSSSSLFVFPSFSSSDYSIAINRVCGASPAFPFEVGKRCFHFTLSIACHLRNV